MKPGLTSITFRNKSICEIAELVKKSNLSVIEWGGDIHCPPDDNALAERAFFETKENGLEISSYGTYFRLGVNSEEEFEKACKTASLLDTHIVRIWGYNKDCCDVSKQEYDFCVNQAKNLAKIAKKYDLTICFEYHRQTLTRKASFAKKLIEDIGCDNVRLYWQPNPEISHEENCKELEEVLEYVVNIHCFHWTWDGANIRHKLSDGKEEWKKYIDIAKKGNVKNILIEFVLDDDDTNFLDDARALKELLT